MVFILYLDGDRYRIGVSDLSYDKKNVRKYGKFQSIRTQYLVAPQRFRIKSLDDIGGKSTEVILKLTARTIGSIQ